MENGGNDKYWRGQTSNNNNNNVWWDLAHLGLGEEEEEEEMVGASRPYDYWTGNVVLMDSHGHHHHQVVVEEEEEAVVMMMNPPPPPPPPPPISNGGDTKAKQQQQQQQQYLSSSSSLYSGGSSHVYPDPHLTCLKLGHTNNNNNNNKRRQYYFEDGTNNIISTTTTTTTTTALWKKGKCNYSSGGVFPLVNVGFGGSSTAVVIPKCQVDGCHVELLCAREYHRRHKVCEVHSKATKVELLGIEQRFCQQCSRFHVMTEFDDSKRSCRRRLAGHNERRRKMSSSSNNNSSSSSSNDSTTTTITSTTRKCFNKGGAGGLLPYTNTPSPPRVSNALSLLSRLGVSPVADLIPGKYSTAVALQNRFAENCANIVASKIFLNQPISKNIKPKILASCNKKENG